MAATTTPSIHSLIKRVALDYPTIKFEAGSYFWWSPEDRTVYYVEASNDIASLLHELAHGILGHTTYQRDIELLVKEREAWDYAKHTLSSAYAIPVSLDTVEEALDSYRDWLHARSTCPTCGSIGMQVQKALYACPACTYEWKVNEARTCALRRYKQKKHRL